MTVLVLGAGVVGVATAYYLAGNGADVVVIDRQSGPGLETSFANGGLISPSHATPWAGPGTPWKALKWLGQADAPLLFRLRWDPALWAWGLRFLANCTAARVRINTERALRVALYSRTQLAALRVATGIRYDDLERGILSVYRDRREYDAALAQVESMNEAGCHHGVVDAAGCVAIEPALSDVAEDLVGGVYSAEDESGDAYLFTARLAELAAAQGVTFRYGTSVRAVRVNAGRVTGIETDAGPVEAKAVVVALGSHSPKLLRPLGLNVPIYPAKGYSATVGVPADGVAPSVALIDDQFKMVYSRLGNRLRIAGTAELTGYDESLNERRARVLVDRAMVLFPRCGDPAQAELWAGLRPTMPDSVPVMGQAGPAGLFLNTGHGTLGWTMACGAGRAIADLATGRRPEISLDGLGPERFR